MISSDRLRKVLRYDAEGGGFYWREKISAKVVIGARAGTAMDSGYREIAIFGRRYREHRLAWLYMTGEWPPAQIDHKNGARSDNRWTNLRSAVLWQNAGNMKRPSHNKSGVKGVYWDVSRQKWHAQIQVHGRSTSLGRFASISDAQQAYEAAAQAHFGQFARTV